MPKNSFSGVSAGSGINKNVNNVVYVQDKGNKNITGYANIYGDLKVYDQKKEAQIAYLYVKFDPDSYNDFENIYVFRTIDGGVTREVVPLTLVGNTLALFEGSPPDIPNVTYSRYRSGLGAGIGYANTSPPTYNASFIYDPLYTYYIAIWSVSDTVNLDFQAYVSLSAIADGFSYINLLPNSTDDGVEVVWQITVNTSDWERVTLTSATTITDIANYTTPSVVFSVDSQDGSTTIGGALSLSGDVTIDGDLTVNGTTTTIDTTNLRVEDTVIELNRNGSSNVDMGFVFTKSGAKPIFYWNSFYSRFDLATSSSATGTTTDLHSLSQSSASLNIGNLGATSANLSASLNVGTTLGVTGVTTLNNNVGVNWANGTTRTFQIQKTGALFPHFYVDNLGNVLFGTAGATFQTLANIDASVVTSNFYITNFDTGLVTYKNDAKIKVNKYATTTTPFITLNADRTGASQEADAVLVEVERGSLTNSYIKWDEANNWWSVSDSLYAGTILNDTFNGVQATLNYGAGQADEDVVLTIKDGSNNDSITINAGGDISTSGVIEMDKPTLTTTPAITLNADCVGMGTESSVIALSVTRAEEPSSTIKWNETDDRWDLSHSIGLAKDGNNIVINFDETSNPTSSGGVYVNRGNYLTKGLYWNETSDSWDVEGHFNLGHTRRTRYYVYLRTASPVNADVGSYFYFYTLDGSVHRACELSVKNTSILLSTPYTSGQDNYTRYSLSSTVYQPTLAGQVICIASFDLPEGSTIYFKEYLNSGMDYLYVSRGGSHYFGSAPDYILLDASNTNIQITVDSNTKTNVTHTASYVSQEYNYQISEIYRSVKFRGSIDFNPTTVNVTSTNQVIGVGGENMIVIIPTGVTSCYIAPSFTQGKVIRIFNYSTANFTFNVIQSGHNGINYHFDINNASLTISRESTAQLLWYIDGSGNGHWLSN